MTTYTDETVLPPLAFMREFQPSDNLQIPDHVQY